MQAGRRLQTVDGSVFRQTLYDVFNESTALPQSMLLCRGQRSRDNRPLLEPAGLDVQTYHKTCFTGHFNSMNRLRENEEEKER